MTNDASSTPARIIPAMRYNDAPAAIEFLCKAFGFKEHLVVPMDDGMIAHAQLTYGKSMIMLGSTRDNEFGKLQKSVKDAGVVTQSCYIIVPDADEHYRRAVAAGAEIVVELKDEDYGGRGYTCRDPEGNLWNFGTYDPWAD
jgi:uncharacterized glyoxalase superfamily protein PhnB